MKGKLEGGGGGCEGSGDRRATDAEILGRRETAHPLPDLHPRGAGSDLKSHF